MAHLPPKAPNLATPNGWADHILLSQQRVTSMEYAAANNNVVNSSSWVDEFFDFSSNKRGSSHRRSISDSVAFLEMPLLDQECGRSSTTTQGSGNNSSSEFDRFDDNDQLIMSMFTDDDDVAGSVPTVSSPSDHNSISEDANNNMINDDEHMKQQLKTEPEEVDSSSCKTIHAQLPSCTNNNDNSSSERLTDPKRIKRILANRQSAQRSRVRKLQYISELERSVTSLQTEVSVLSPRVSFLDQQRMVLTVDNGVLNQRMAALAQDKIFKDAHQEALKREIERLRQIYYYQQNMMKKMENDTQPKSQPSPMDTTGPLEKDQLVH